MDTRIIKIDDVAECGRELMTAGRVLRYGGIVAFPTETVYGLGGNALHKEAANHIFPNL